MQAIQTALRLTQEGKGSLHHDLKLRRREQRESNSSRCSSQMEEPVSPEHNLELQKEIDTIIQHQKELDKQRREKEQHEKEQQLELQRELERQVEELKKEKACMLARIAQLEQESKQQKERIEELVLTQQILEKALNDQIEACLEEESKRKELERRLEEEKQEVEQLRRAQEGSERSTPKEEEIEEVNEPEEIQQPLEREEVQSPSPTPLPESPEMTITQLPLEKAKSLGGQRNQRQWNVQLTRLMKPITPADHFERRSPVPSCPVQDQALTSNEFLTKVKATLKKEEEEDSEED